MVTRVAYRLPVRAQVNVPNPCLCANKMLEYGQQTTHKQCDISIGPPNPSKARQLANIWNRAYPVEHQGKYLIILPLALVTAC